MGDDVAFAWEGPGDRLELDADGSELGVGDGVAQAANTTEIAAASPAADLILSACLRCAPG